ncbi:MAG TPA: hypothetical protein VFJ09_16910 [Nocardioidaceae bacterium]|nr:hypothetical protein [Nocardioidaceae bacterium]
MQHTRRLSALLLAIALGAGACGAQGETLGEASNSSFHVAPIAGTSLSKVTLSAAGYQRVGIVMTTVRAASGARTTGLTMVPDSAVWYDAYGRTWVYVKAGQRTFVRVPVVVTGYAGALAVLRRGPAIGTAVVKVGAAELYGAEQGVPGE